MSQEQIYSNSQLQTTRKARLRHLRVRSTIILSMAVLFALGILFYSTVTAKVSEPNTTPTAVAPSVTTKPVTAGGEPQKPTAEVKKPVNSIVRVPNCTPAQGTIRPNVPTLTSASSGLVQSPMSIQTYTVYGNSTEQISNQINNCSPVVSEGVRFAASAEYTINWTFQYQGTEDGLCKITNASVGLGLSKTLPKWQPSSPNKSLQTRWDNYIANLSGHEDGHINLDKKYAEMILSELTNYPPAPCDTINSSANSRANALVAELNQANNRYDAATDHGTTEGANL